MPGDYQYILSILETGTEADFEELAALVEGFPDGRDEFLHRRWILNALDHGSKAAIEWMIHRGVDLSFVDEAGYSPLLSAIESRRPDKYEILELLLEAGAPPDDHGVNDWTPLHLAAARNDVESLRLLVKYGADPTVRTRIDDCATPLEEARNLGSSDAVVFLERIS